MNKPEYSDKITKLATIQQAVERYKLGRTKLMEIAENENAVRRFGRSVRIDVPAMDKAISNY